MRSRSTAAAKAFWQAIKKHWKKVLLAAFGMFSAGFLGAVGGGLFDWVTKGSHDPETPASTPDVVTEMDTGVEPVEQAPRCASGDDHPPFPNASTREEVFDPRHRLNADGGLGYVWYGRELTNGVTHRTGSGTMELVADEGIDELPRLETIKPGSILINTNRQFLRQLPTTKKGRGFLKPPNSCWEVLEGRRFYFQTQTCAVSQGWVPVKEATCP